MKIASHDYERKNDPKVWNDLNGSECRARAVKRAQFILGLVSKKSILPDFLVDTNLYGLGKERTIEAFWKKAGIDPYSKTASNSCQGMYIKK